MGSADIEELIKKYGIRKQISREMRMMAKQLFWLKVAIILFLIEIGFYALAIYKLYKIIQ